MSFFNMFKGGDESTKVEQGLVDKITADLKAELGRNPTPKEVEARLQETTESQAEDFGDDGLDALMGDGQVGDDDDTTNPFEGLFEGEEAE